MLVRGVKAVPFDKAFEQDVRKSYQLSIAADHVPYNGFNYTNRPQDDCR